MLYLLLSNSPVCLPACPHLFDKYRGSVPKGGRRLLVSLCPYPQKPEAAFKAQMPEAPTLEFPAGEQYTISQGGWAFYPALAAPGRPRSFRASSRGVSQELPPPRTPCSQKSTFARARTVLRPCRHRKPMHNAVVTRSGLATVQAVVHRCLRFVCLDCTMWHRMMGPNNQKGLRCQAASLLKALLQSGICHSSNVGAVEHAHPHLFGCHRGGYL